MKKSLLVIAVIIVLSTLIVVILMNLNRVSGTYVSTGDSLYKSFTFKGKNTVVIKDGFIGFDFATSYEQDGEFIRIKTDQSDLLLIIRSRDVLIGEGWAKGTYERIEVD